MVAIARNVVAVLGLSGLVLVACGKKNEDPETIPVGSASAAATVAAEQPAATGTAATPTPQPPVQQPRPTGASIDGCCAGINNVKNTGKDAIAKSKAAGAALACPGIAKAVKDGRTSRADGLTQIKALLQGVSVPECN